MYGGNKPFVRTFLYKSIILRCIKWPVIQLSITMTKLLLHIYIVTAGYVIFKFTLIQLNKALSIKLHV